MKKITFLFALLCASVMGWAADQNTDLPIAAGCDAYAGKVQWKAIDGVATPSNVVEIQKSGNIPSVYVTFADAGFNQVEGCEWDNHVSGACIWVHLPLTYEYTNIYIKQNGTVRWGFTIYYKDGTPNGTPCTDETAPSVSAVSVGSITYNSAVLTVTALDNDGGSGISKYIVKNGDDQIASSTSNEITLTKLTPNTTYNTLKVYAQDGCNNESSAFDVESFKTENLIYNQFPTGHLSNPTFGDIYGRILLTIKKVNNTTIAVKVDPNNNGTRGIKYMNIIVNGVNHEYGNNDGSGDDLTGYFEIGGLASLNFTFNLFFYCNTPNWTTNQFSVTESQLYVEAPSDTEKPSMADATVTKVSQTHNSVVISITDAEDNVGVTKYVVKNHSNNSSVGEYTPSEGKITVSDLSPSTGYNWDIYAKDAAGNVSDNYKNISFTTDALVSNYCGETLTSTDNNATVDMSCEFKNNKYIITFTNPTLSGEASVLSGFNGSFCTIGGTGAHDARDHYGVNNSEKIVLEFDGVPNFYTDLYINIPGGNQRIFSWPNDVVWGTCPDVAVTGVSLNHDELNMVVGGGTQTLVATIAPTNATNQNVTWVSDDTDVATVENGVVTAVGAGTAHITVTTQDGSTFTGDYVIGAMGREANVKDIGLDKVGLEYTASGIPVDGNMRTKVDNIFATGDVADTGQAKLVTVAIHQSKYLAKYLLGQTDEEITYPVVPAVVFTLPRIATVGIPVYKALNMDGYNIHRIRYGDSYSIELKNDRTAEVTVVTDPDMNIVGAELYGPEAENMANIFAFIINKNISLEELDYFIYAFPSSISVMLYKMHNIHYKIGDRKE